MESILTRHVCWYASDYPSIDTLIAPLFRDVCFATYVWLALVVFCSQIVGKVNLAKVNQMLDGSLMLLTYLMFACVLQVLWGSHQCPANKPCFRKWCLKLLANQRNAHRRSLPLKVSERRRPLIRGFSAGRAEDRGKLRTQVRHWKRTLLLSFIHLDDSVNLRLFHACSEYFSLSARADCGIIMRDWKIVQHN